jgi:CheY-like chemotaxis protein
MTPHRGLGDFHQLMRHRIMDILLVASPYDAFVLEEAGQIGERVVGEFRNLDLHYGPGLTTVSTGAEALELVGAPSRFNLIISGLALADMNGAELADQVRALGKDIPVVLLAFDTRELDAFARHHDLSAVERVFLWQGDARILLAIVKYVEDRRNAAHDTQMMGVQVIILIEDSVRYYSSFLPVIYAELLHHSRRLISEAVNASDKIMRMRARPKILLSATYEDAWQLFTQYEDDVLGVISDVEFPAGGALSPTAGLDFARQVRARWPDIPVLLQSSNPAHADGAAAIGATFLRKGSPTLLAELRRFMIDYFGFGDFVFRRPGGELVGMAHDLTSLEEWIAVAPADSLAYHAARNHFSSWLKARTEFALADELRPRKPSDFPDPEGLRSWLVTTIARYRRARSLVAVADFDPAAFDPRHDFHRLGGGSLGGKARGLAFLRTLLAQRPVTDGTGAHVGVPAAVVLTTEVFDRFLDDADLRGFALHASDDDELTRRLLAAPFPPDVRADLAALMPRLDFPLAVRSSSLLEDSQHQPFAGVYDTYMLANVQASPDARLDALIAAIVRVYASMFSRHAKAYLAATPYRLEEEKMAVIIQRVVGAAHGPRFYPSLSGTARSHNFYPTPPMVAGDGIAAIALGLGRAVVSEGSCLRFCPRYPRHLVQFSSVKDILANTQRAFWALDLSGTAGGAAMRETSYPLEVAEADGTLGAVASTYSRDNDAIYDGISRPGVRVVSFASILKHDAFPLATLLDRLLALGRWGMGGPVEIEFAVDLAARELAFLQLRPLPLITAGADLALDDVAADRVVCKSRRVLGHGRIDDVRDVLVVDRRFDRAASRAAAAELAHLAAELAGRPYLLIGVGRWGSSDPWLGIPVSWDQIAGARVIVEAGFADFTVTPSQGTHFFQNLTSFQVGYFTVNPDAGDGFVDWAWLAAAPAARATTHVRHLRFDHPLVVQMDSKRGEGVIEKPRGG